MAESVRRAAAKTFEDLVVWQKAHDFVLRVYRGCAAFPKQEQYGLTSQLCRAAVSIPANIAEGFRRITRAEKLRFLNISQSSLEECRYYLILAHDLGYLDTRVLMSSLQEVSRLLEGYCSAIRASNNRNTATNSGIPSDF